MNKLFPLILALISLEPAACAGPQANLVFILADDLGWSDTTLYGTTKFYRTPNIQRLAARGMTFTRAYSASPLCSPTRASILTGLSPARHGITSPSCHTPKVALTATPGQQAAPHAKTVPVNSVTRLKTDYYTLAEALNDAGYATGHFGKWHLGHEPYSPLQHGFGMDVPHWPGPGPAGSYVAPWKFPDFDPDTPGEHIEDRMANEAVAFMEAHHNQPFYLNYWMFSVHAPFDAKRKLIEKHRQRVDPNDPQRSPTYAAMIESMDDAVGTLIDTLDQFKLSENTIIVLASDNGGNMYNEIDGTTPTSNVPLRGGKATMYEGGVRGPCIVVWPGKVQPGSESDQPIQSCDFYPTLLEMLSLKAQPNQHFDGISIVPALLGKPLKRENIFTYFPHAPRVPDWLPPAASVHHGDWKLIRIFHGGDDGAHRWKLFNLAEDIGEQHDLSAKKPEIVKQLDGLIEDFLVETEAVRPTINPRFDPAMYRLEDEGKSRRKSTQTNKRKPAKPVAGWIADHNCELSTAAGSLVIQCSGGDPHLSFRFPEPLPAGDYRLLMTMTSEGSGRGQFFWEQPGVSPRFFRDRSVSFDIQQDGKSHLYDVAFAAQGKIASVRLDPGQNRGEIRISEMRLQRADAVVHRWFFQGK